MFFRDRTATWTIILLNRQEKWNGIRGGTRAGVREQLKLSAVVPMKDRDSLRFAVRQRARRYVILHAELQVWAEKLTLKTQNQSETGSAPGVVGARHEPRFKLEVDVSIRTRSRGVLAGYTVDISESGISAMLKIEVPLSEIVELGFMLPIGRVNISAMVRQRDAFRYGFQFIGSDATQDVIRSTCRQLAVEQSLREP
jgi:PilZ domain